MGCVQATESPPGQDSGLEQMLLEAPEGARPADTYLRLLASKSVKK